MLMTHKALTWCLVQATKDCWRFRIYEKDKFHAQFFRAFKQFYNLEVRLQQHLNN